MIALIFDIREFGTWPTGEEPAFTKNWLLDRNPLGGSTKRRLIYAPNDAMRFVHAKLIAYVRRLRAKHISMQTAPVSWPPVANVLAHRGGRYFILMDLHDAYRNVDLDRMVGVLVQLQPGLTSYREMIRTFLTRFCFADEGGLATGAPASPDLFNLYAGALIDEPLVALLKEYEEKTRQTVRYTRYIDDLTISTTRRRIGASVRWRVKQIVKTAGFTLSRKKTAPSLDIRKGPITITGLRLERGGRIFVPRHYVRLFRKELRRALREQDWSVDTLRHFAGMNGVFCSGIPRDQGFTHLEGRVAGLFDRYRKERRHALESPSP